MMARSSATLEARISTAPTTTAASAVEQLVVQRLAGVVVFLGAGDLVGFKLFGGRVHTGVQDGQFFHGQRVDLLGVLVAHGVAQRLQAVADVAVALVVEVDRQRVFFRRLRQRLIAL